MVGMMMVRRDGDTITGLKKGEVKKVYAKACNGQGRVGCSAKKRMTCCRKKEANCANDRKKKCRRHPSSRPLSLTPEKSATPSKHIARAIQAASQSMTVGLQTRMQKAAESPHATRAMSPYTPRRSA